MTDIIKQLDRVMELERLADAAPEAEQRATTNAWSHAAMNFDFPAVLALIREKDAEIDTLDAVIGRMSDICVKKSRASEKQIKEQASLLAECAAMLRDIGHSDSVYGELENRVAALLAKLEGK